MRPRTIDRDANGRGFQVTINRLGFRGRLPAETKAPGVLRVAVFGDSMVYGIGVPDGETVPARRQEQLLKALPGQRVEVLNFGIPTTFLVTSLRAYRDYGRAFRPDVVIFTDARIRSNDSAAVPAGGSARAYAASRLAAGAANAGITGPAPAALTSPRRGDTRRAAPPR